MEGLRGVLARALAKAHEHFFAFPLECIESTAQRMGGRDLVSGLFEAVVGALLDKGAYDTLGEIWDESLFRRAIRFALSKGAELPLEDGSDGGGVFPLRQAQDVTSVAGAVALYKAIHDHSHAALFLKELSRSPLLGATEKFDRELELARQDWKETSFMPLEWLEACIERSRPDRSTEVGSAARRGPA